MFLRKRRNTETVIFERFKKEPVKKETEVKEVKKVESKPRRNTKKEAKIEIVTEETVTEE